MKNGVEKVEIVGNVGRDPEMRYTPNGTAVTKASVAVNVGRGDGELTKWYDIVAFGKSAEYLAKWARKGDMVHVEGRLADEPPAWIDKKTGEPRSKYEIVVSKVTILVYSDAERGDATSQPETSHLDTDSYF